MTAVEVVAGCCCGVVWVVVVVVVVVVLVVRLVTHNFNHCSIASALLLLPEELMRHSWSRSRLQTLWANINSSWVVFSLTEYLILHTVSQSASQSVSRSVGRSDYWAKRKSVGRQTVDDSRGTKRWSHEECRTHIIFATATATRQVPVWDRPAATTAELDNIIKRRLSSSSSSSTSIATSERKRESPFVGHQTACALKYCAMKVKLIPKLRSAFVQLVPVSYPTSSNDYEYPLAVVVFLVWFRRF